MSQMELPITPEEIAALPPEFQAILRAVIELYERRVSELRAEVAALKAEFESTKKTTRMSSVPPSTEHPHARPQGRPDSRERRSTENRNTDDRELVAPTEIVLRQKYATETIRRTSAPTRGVEDAAS